MGIVNAYKILFSEVFIVNGIINTNSVKGIIGRRIRAARENTGMTRGQFVDKLNGLAIKLSGEEDVTLMTQERLKQWEYGKNAVSIEWIPLICNVLKCDVGYLFGEYSEKKREFADAHETTGLSEKAIRQLYLLHNHPQCKTPENGGLGIMAKGYSIGHTDILSEMLESQHMLEFFNCIGFYLVYGGALPNDAYTNNEDELTGEEHQRFYRWANNRGLEIQPRSDICEMHLQKACDELKKMLKDILEKVKKENG